MGNSVSHEQGNRHADATDRRNTWSASLHQARDASVPRQITVCLMPNAPESSIEETVAAAGIVGDGCSKPSAVQEESALVSSDSSQKVLLWNCNPTDSFAKNEAYAATESIITSTNSKETSVNLNKLLLNSHGHKHARGYNFDMHPAVSSDVAASLPRSSSSDDSSDSSFQGRSFSNEETMPHGPDHSSDEDDDTIPALTSPRLPVSPRDDNASGDRNEGGLAACQAGRLVIHPRSSTAAEQVVWILHKQQLLAAPYSSMHADTPRFRGQLVADSACAGHHHERIVSPAFILPCVKSPSQHVTTEWCIAMHPQQLKQAACSSGTSTCQVALGLCWAPLAAPSATSSSSPADCQAPGCATTAADADAAGSGAAVHCRGRVSLHLESSKTAITHADFDMVFQRSGQFQELPLILKLADTSLGTAAASSPGQQEQQPASAAALAGRFEEFSLVVDFTTVRLLQSAQPATAAVLGGSIAAKRQQQQQQQQQQLGQQDILNRQKDQDQANGNSSSSSSGMVRELGSSAPAARQLEAVLLSTSPRMLVVDGFFSAQLCNNLMDLAEGKLVRSRVASGSETPSRTSWSHFFVKDAARQALIMSAESQIEALFKSSAVRGPFPPLTKVEALQVVKYHEGEFYHEHYDNRADSPLTRAATIIVYLSDTDQGGATSFPRAVTGWHESADWQLPPKVSFGPGGQGIKVFPAQGRALIFWSKRADGSEDPNSIHAADAVVKGQKWIATRWMKDD